MHSGVQSSSRSLLQSIPLEILEQIVLATLAHPFLGPPSALTNFLSLNTYFHNALATNASLFLRIFQLKFDIAAPIRRFAHRPASVFHHELKSRFLLLKRFRSPNYIASSPPTLEADFWKAVLLFFESDGRNEAQLIEYALLPSLLDSWWRSSLLVGRDANGGYPIENTTNSLGLYLLWRTQTPQAVHACVMSEDYSLMNALSPYNIACFKYANAYLPEIHYDPPITHSVAATPDSFNIAHTPYPVYRQLINYSHADILSSRHGVVDRPIEHFGLQLRLSPPILTQTSLLLFFTYHEVRGIQVTPRTPITRADRDALGIQQPSRQDLDDHNRYANTRFVHRSPPDGSLPGSRRFDEDFQRMIWCGNPFDSPFRGQVYKLGSMHGLWEGRMLYPDVSGYRRLLASAALPENFEHFFLLTSPFKVRIKEWYCTTLEDPLPYGYDAPGDGLLKAWFPTDAELDFRQNVLEIESDDTVHEYHRWLPNETIFHEEDLCSFCDSPPEDVMGYDGPYYHDRSFVPSPSPCPKHLDVILTGETDPEHAKAWGDYKFYGRVRPYDGLIVLVREWAKPEPNGHGRWVFRGYLTADQNFIGRWRDGATEPTAPGMVEGSFTLNKRE